MSGSASLTFEIAQIARAAAGWRSAGGAALRRDALRATGTALLLDALRAAAPARSGRLRRSIQARRTANGAAFFGLAYGAFVVHGTAPHLILPRVRAALSWPGAAHPVRRVQHPGTRANDFPRRAAAQAKPALRRALRDDGQQVIRLLAEQT